MGVFRTLGHRAGSALVERAVVSERPPHALLLVGPERVGKTTLALDLAAGLLCLDDVPARRPCRACAACRKVEHGNHPDLHQLQPEGAGQQIRVGQVQALAAQLALLPLEGRVRLAVIERAQRLNLDAQNALLKTLEEPPPAVVLVLVADDSSTLLPTVLSRCVRLRLAPVAPAVVAELLTQVGGVDTVRAMALARLAGGRPGAALALAQQPEASIAHARMCRTLLELLGSSRRRRLAAQADLLADGALLAAAADPGDSDGERPTARPREADRTARRASPAERRAAAAQVLVAWRAMTRDLAFAAHGARAELKQHDLIDELLPAARDVDPPAVARFLARIDGVARALAAYANPELALDTLLLEWPTAGSNGA